MTELAGCDDVRKRRRLERNCLYCERVFSLKAAITLGIGGEGGGGEGDEWADRYSSKLSDVEQRRGVARRGCFGSLWKAGGGRRCRLP